ncbi:helicase associated domain-containing protein [Streptomyces sp. 2231.1]|uniref:helicase associated domain-containing protein n=1 Tax=Streptomyces sp. 2231.1 TaxID=1855347 RepID=UPI00352598EB
MSHDRAAPGLSPTPRAKGRRHRAATPTRAADTDRSGPAEYSYPLGRWLADQRRALAAGRTAAERAADLDELGMVWDPADVGRSPLAPSPSRQS